MNALVSVIIPVYNTERYLGECMQSVLCQSYSTLEVILVDDGSTDSCPYLCDEYEKKDCRVKVIHKQNGGLSSARNAGISIANGKFLTFVDSDDMIAPNMVETMVLLARKESAEIVKISMVRKYHFSECVSTDGDYSVVSTSEVLRRIYTDPPQIISACGKLFHSRLFSDTAFPEGRYYEDEFTTPKLYNSASKIVFSESVLYYYMQRNNESIMRSSLTKKKIQDSLYVLKERISFFEKIGSKTLVKKSKIDYCYKLFHLVDECKASKSSASISELIRKEKRAFDALNPGITAYVAMRLTCHSIKQRICSKQGNKE